MLDPKLKPFLDRQIEAVIKDGLFTFYWDGIEEYDDNLPKVITEEDFHEITKYLGEASVKHDIDLLIAEFTPPTKGKPKRVHALCLYDRPKFEAEVIPDFPQLKGVDHKDFMTWWVADSYIKQFSEDDDTGIA
jgi:hypothetical protein